MTDSQLAGLFDELADCLESDFIQAPAIAAHGETMLLFVYTIIYYCRMLVIGVIN